VIFLPIIGVLLYLGTQGRHLVERQRARETAARQRFDGYVRSVSTVSNSDNGAAQIAEARRLLEEGVIDDREYEALKQKALAR
jgi:hypothetical protein